MLTEARAEYEWLREGSRSVQDQALRDFDRAMSAFYDPDNPAQHPAPRTKRGGQGFVIRDTSARRVSRNVGEIHVPKCGRVRFRWSRDLPAELGMARVTLDAAGRWHVSFPALESPVDRAPTGATDRRKDWAEKASTRLVRDHDLIVFEKLSTPNMVRKPKPKPDPEQPGRFLPNRRRQKAGLSKGILASAWGVLAGRTQEKAAVSGVAVVYVDPRFTSQQCHACGHTEKGNRDSQAVFTCLKCGHYDHADTNAARNILARGLAAQAVPAHARGQRAPRPRKTRQLAAGTTRSAG